MRMPSLHTLLPIDVHLPLHKVLYSKLAASKSDGCALHLSRNLVMSPQKRKIVSISFVVNCPRCGIGNKQIVNQEQTMQPS
jgi:hypothetical protein